ncbi:hypothetical protein D3C77_258650 [compost metagenome]
MAQVFFRMVRAVKQGIAAFLVSDEGHTGKGNAVTFGVFTSSGKPGGDQANIVSIGPISLRAVGIDGDIENGLPPGVHITCCPGLDAMHLEHQAQGFAQAFTAKLAGKVAFFGAAIGGQNHVFAFLRQIDILGQLDQVVGIETASQRLFKG